VAPTTWWCWWDRPITSDSTASPSPTTRRSTPRWGPRQSRPTSRPGCWMLRASGGTRLRTSENIRSKCSCRSYVICCRARQSCRYSSGFRSGTPSSRSQIRLRRYWPRGRPSWWPVPTSHISSRRAARPSSTRWSSTMSPATTRTGCWPSTSDIRRTSGDDTWPVVAALGAREARVLRHANSGDASGDTSAVVGYLAAALLKE